MNTKIYAFAIIMILGSSLINAQMVELTFTGKSGSFNVTLDSVSIENLTQGGDTMLYTPDTVIVLGTVGIDENNKNMDFYIQNYPNPFISKTFIDVYLPETSYLEVSVFNVTGQEVSSFKNNLTAGKHTFSFYSEKIVLYFLTARYKSEARTIRITSLSSGHDQKCELKYIGSDSDNEVNKYLKSSKGFVYTFGDQLKFIGYSGYGRDTIVDSPTFDVTYEFNSNAGIPCPGIPSFTYGGQTYPTVLIGNKCWMKENLNIGNRIDSINNSSDNGIIEKFCYDDDTNNCLVYGGLYQWDELMEYDTIPGGQGICPTGWHLPTDDEWKILEGTVDSLFPVGDPEWDKLNYRGYDAGGKLKETDTTHWQAPNTVATDLFGFTALPGGFWASALGYIYINENSTFWTSNQSAPVAAYYRTFTYDYKQSFRHAYYKNSGFSVLCLKN